MGRDSLKNVCKLINQTQKSLPAAQAFLSDLKHSIELDAEKDYRKPSQTYKPSSMHCIRCMYYQMIGAEGDRDSASYCGVGICNSGSDIHVRIQQAVEGMKNNGIDCEYIDVADYVRSRGLDHLEIISKNGMETKLFNEDLKMSFMCDGIIKYRNHYYILELKTEASFKWDSREDVDPKHYNQGTAYSISLRIPEVLFVYINRNVLDMKAYMFVPTDEQKQDLVGLIDNCDGYVMRMICPPKPEDITRKTCEYCSYKTQCKKDG